MERRRRSRRSKSASSPGSRCCTISATKQRWWDDVKVGDQLPERVFGPHSVASFATEWRAYLVNTWGTMNLRKLDLLALGFTPEMAGFENDPDMQLINPEITDGAYYGPSRGHLVPALGAQDRHAARLRLRRVDGRLGNRLSVGLGGRARHGRAFGRQLPRPGAFGRHHHPDRGSRRQAVDEDGRHLVQVKHKMANQKGTTMATAMAEIQLPKRPR